MAGKVLDLKDIGIREDTLGCTIARFWTEWNTLRREKVNQWEEVRRYVYATDTTQTTNSQLPWKNKTTIPKLCQIRDNLYSNYVASLFPKRKWFIWDADEKDSSEASKRKAIESYISHVVSQPHFKDELEKLVLDYIDYGNCFGTVEWIDSRQELPERTQVGYVGPAIRRISPVDIVFNPIASSFEKSPKIVRSLVSLGEVKELLERLSVPEDKEAYEALFNYLVNVRHEARQTAGDLRTQNDYYRVDGFTNFQSYLAGDFVELLTFYGDIYDYDTKTFHRNQVIIVADRHKVLTQKVNPSLFGYPPIFHVGWRKRQDNLWAMGPLDNLVGLQYRIDHIENLKADVFDLITFPPLKIKGYVDDFEWGPFERIHVGDDGDVVPITPPFQVLEANIEIQQLEQKMEEMAGSPKEAMGFRTPGEKTMYEVQRLENAASRIYQNKITQFEEKLTEKLLNACLEYARRNITTVMSVKVFDDEFNLATFMELTPTDLTGAGRIRPVAARHFAEKAERIQNLNNFFASVLGQDQDIKAHFSSIKLARMFEEMLDIEEYQIVLPYVRLSEQADAQRMAQTQQEQLQIEAGTAAGIRPDDYDLSPEEQQQMMGAMFAANTSPMGQGP